MNIIYKFIFLVFMIAGVVAIFLVSWFWSLLILPMILILGVDIVSSLLRKKDKKV